MTTTTTVKSWKFTVTRNDREMRIVSPSGAKTVVIDLTKVDEAGLSAAEQTVLAPMECEGEVGVPYQYELNAVECTLIASVRDKIAALAAKKVETTTTAAIHRGLANKATASGLDSTERKVTLLKNVVAQTERELTLLNYDIPSVKNAECPNPSRLLWWHGFRLTKSCWVLPKDRLTHPQIAALLDLWREHQIKVYTIDQSPEQAELIRDIARKELSDELVRLHTSLIENIDSADRAFKAIEADVAKTARELEIADQIRFNKVRAIIKDAGEALNASIACAETFDMTDSVKDLINGLREAIASQRATFNAAAALKNRRPV